MYHKPRHEHPHSEKKTKRTVWLYTLTHHLLTAETTTLFASSYLPSWLMEVGGILLSPAVSPTGPLLSHCSLLLVSLCAHTHTYTNKQANDTYYTKEQLRKSSTIWIYYFCLSWEISVFILSHSIFASWYWIRVWASDFCALMRSCLSTSRSYINIMAIKPATHKRATGGDQIVCSLLPYPESSVSLCSVNSRYGFGKNYPNVSPLCPSIALGTSPNSLTL